MKFIIVAFGFMLQFSINIDILYFSVLEGSNHLGYVRFLQNNEDRKKMEWNFLCLVVQGKSNVNLII